MKWCNVFVDHANLEISHMFKSASNPVRRILASHDWSTGENRLRAVQNLMPPPCLVLRILPSRFVYMQWTTNDKNPYELDVQITLNCHMSHVYKGEHKLVYYRGLKSRLPVWLLTSHLLHVPGAKEWQVIKSDLNSSVDLFSMALHKQYWLVMLLFQSTRKIWSTYINSNVKLYIHLHTTTNCTRISKSQFLKHGIYIQQDQSKRGVWPRYKCGRHWRASKGKVI